ncbi:copper resistance protein NlpE N-terminal domain-containing protein [Thiomicrospira microaerophila]|uniref:copper resistance protein NlpE n=1 Tax=Thiomicrospira microaerophila TaxID=406020 RepID=UPI00200BE04A|nr:copper resistance protein NlpE [Thiomicrospira microaerophila]UQB41963.1 copper resistance protein NlpE N-terminal domain-containing protein [Thiomicrospira microaerophila]
MNHIARKLSAWQVIVFAALLSSLLGCSSVRSPVDHHTSQLALDWAGLYQGTLPCADCEAILWQLELKQNHLFKLTRTYLGKSMTPFSDQGHFIWAQDGQRVFLTSHEQEKIGFFVGENRLWLLDQQGQPITGNLSSQYSLVKINDQ